jgi:xanthine dehydrogenase molybdenum-binding subunit
MVDRARVAATVNGMEVEFLCEPRQSLLDCLRDILGLTGTKAGCDDGNCGACSVLLNGRLVNSCLVLGVEIDGQAITTVEGLAGPEGWHPLQRAFIDHDALQCGYCTPGTLLAAKALLDLDPDPDEQRIRRWLAGNLCRCTGYDRIVLAVQEAAKIMRGTGPASHEHPTCSAHHLPKEEKVKTVMEQTAAQMLPLEIIGTRPPPYGAADKVTGRAIYAADVDLPGLIHGRVLRSPHAHARLRAIDTRRALALPGVLAVITAADLPGGDAGTPDQGELTCEQQYAADSTLARHKVLYTGHAVAAVAAVSPQVAEDALSLIAVDYELLPPVMDVREAMREGAPLLHEEMVTDSMGSPGTVPSNVASHLQFIRGDPEAGFAEADLIVERSFRTVMVHQGYVEPPASTAVWSADGSLTVWACTQGPFGLREQLAGLLHCPLAKIRIIPCEVGGSFGGKNTSFVDALAALLARRAGLPVKVVMTRAEVLLATSPTPGSYIRLKMGARRDGHLCAAQAELCYEAGAFPGAMVWSGAETIFACYNIPHVRIDGYDVVVNKPKAGAYRAPCATQGNFAMEQVIDQLAEGLARDPLEFRLLNSARQGTARLDGTLLPRVGSIEVLEAARAHPHYRAPLEGRHVGRGVAYGYWRNWSGQSSCTLTLNTDGSVALRTGSIDVSGALTSVAMHVAEEMGLPLEHVRIGTGDTDSVGYADYTSGSRTTFATGLAALEAAHDVIEQLRARASFLWGIPLGAVRYAAGEFTSEDGELRLTLRDLAGQTAFTGGPVIGRGKSDAARVAIGAAFAVHIADVAVDPETGKVTVLRYTVVQDVGRAIHPGQVEGQIRGGAVQGIGWGLYEGNQYAPDGSLLNPTLLDNKLPTALDVPAVAPVIVEVPNPHHPFGVRGAGEMPIVPPPAALANAIYRATGRRMEQLPMTPAYILERWGTI